MALRKASAYSRRKEVAYTRRSSVKSKNYVKAIPASKIVKFVMGDIRKFNNGRFEYTIDLVSVENAQLRDNSIESARTLIHKNLEDKFKGNYYLAVSVYPHHVLRENKMLTGAGADRMQTGMCLSFGAPVGIAAQVKPGKKIFTIAVSTIKDTQFVREILKKARAKIACRSKVVLTQVSKPSAEAETAGEEEG